MGCACLHLCALSEHVTSIPCQRSLELTPAFLGGVSVLHVPMGSETSLVPGWTLRIRKHLAHCKKEKLTNYRPKKWTASTNNSGTSVM